jgi:hypothetical protein
VLGGKGSASGFSRDCSSQTSTLFPPNPAQAKTMSRVWVGEKDMADLKPVSCEAKDEASVLVNWTLGLDFSTRSDCCDV